MKELLKGELADFGLGYEVKVEEGKVKIAGTLDLTKLIDKAAEAIPGDSTLEILMVQIAKQAVKSV